jgi:hypothetical protein
MHANHHRRKSYWLRVTLEGFRRKGMLEIEAAALFEAMPNDVKEDMQQEAREIIAWLTQFVGK